MNLKIDKPIRLIELFAGIGSQAAALRRLGANFEHYRISEWEVNAAASYKAIHKENDYTDYSSDLTTEELTEILSQIGISTDGKKPLGMKEIARKNEQWKRTVYNTFKATNNVGSILNIKGDDLGIVDTDKYCYLLTYSFPCQDLSLAGKGKGMAKGDGTRSGLLWEVERLLNECTELPQILLMENVTQVHGKKNKEHFDEWIAFLEGKGYRNFWKDLNAKNFGIPQNRNRCFMVSVLGDYTYKFPKEFPLDIRLKDLLEAEVDEKFYLSDTAIQGRMQSNFRQYNLERSLINEKELHPTILARYEGSPSLLKEPRVIAGIGEKKSNGGPQWYQPTDFNPYYAVQENKIIDPFVVASRGRNPENPSDRRAGIPTEQRLEPNFSGCTNTLTTVQKDNYICEPQVLRAERTEYGKAIRKQYESGEVEEKIGNMREMRPRTDGVSNTITTVQKDNYVAEPIINVVGNYSPSGHDASRIVSMEGLAPTVKENHGTVTAVAELCAHTMGNASRVIVPANNKKGYDEALVGDSINLEQPNSTTRRGRVGHGVAQTLNTSPQHAVVESLRIRKLTPKECWRLMGFDDADFEKAASVNSNSQLYKQAGNSIVVDVLYYIFKNMI